MKNKYSDYDDRVQSKMTKLVKDLKHDIGDIPESYDVQLELIADALDIYYKSLDAIRKNGVLVAGRQGEQIKNPALSSLNSTQLFISKLLNQLALTRASKSKLKLDDDGVAPIDEFID